MRAKTLGSFLGGGLVGAVLLQAAQRLLRRVAPSAPRLDRLGEEAVDTAFALAGRRPPSPLLRRELALAAGVLRDGLLLGLLTRGNARFPWARGLSLGALMGIRAARLPRLVGGQESLGTTAKRGGMRWSALALFAAGGLAAAAFARAAARRFDRRRHDREVFEAARERAAEAVLAGQRSIVH